MVAALIGSVVLVLPTACGSDDPAESDTEQAEPPPDGQSSAPSPAAGGDPFDLTRQAVSHMPMTADALAGGFDTALQLAGNADSDAATLRATLTHLLTEHVYLAGIAVDTAYVTGADSPEFELAAAALDANSVALADAVGSIAGNATRTTFLAAWRSHIGDFVDYAVAAKAGDEAGKQSAVRSLNAYGRAAGRLFADITGGALSATAVRDSLGEHVDTLTATIDAFAAGDGTGFDKLKAAADHMPMTAMALADGIDQAAELAGEPDEQASEVRALLHAKLTEHVYLAGIAVFTAYVDGADSETFQAAAGTLDANSVELSEAVASLTDQATADSFLQAWRQHIDDFVTYAVAVAEADQAGQEAAQRNLKGCAAAQGQTLQKVTGGALPADAAQQSLETHIASLTAAIDALAVALLR